MAKKKEIVFKGKRVDNGEWVEGYLLEGKRTYIVTEHAINYMVVSVSYMASVELVEVIPETVSQFTGLTDKNGKRIFDGDIVTTQPYSTHSYSKKAKEKHFVGVVEYKKYTFKNKFYNKQVYKAGWEVRIDEDMGNYSCYSWSDFWQCEVIGNIYDNPELLKGT